MDKTLVICASGNVGSELVRLLRADHREVIEATSRKELKPGQVHLNLITKEGMKTAFDGVSRAFLLSPPGHTNQHELMRPVIGMAQEKKLNKVVLMTAMGANADDTSPMRKAEMQLENAGIPYNIIRPNWFMQNFHTFWMDGILKQGKIFLPVGKAKGSFIDSRDIASVAYSLLTSDQFSNRDFDLTGGRALDHDEVAYLLTRASGKKITYQDIRPDEMLPGLLSAGLPADYAHFLLMILNYFKLGYAEAVTDSVEKITGKHPRTFEHYVEDYKNMWMKS